MAFPVAAKEVTPLTKTLIESFLLVTREIGGLAQKYPTLSAYSGGFNTENQSEVIRFLKASTAYPEIEGIIQLSPFKDLEEIFNLSERILAIGYYNKVKNPEGVNIFQTEKILRANLNNLRASHASDAIITKAEVTLDYVKAQVELVQQKLNNISDQDKAFVEQNSEWLKQKFVSQ